VLAGVSSRDVTDIELADSFHVATLDNDAPRIFAETLAFVRRLTAGAATGGESGDRSG
jgi:carboxylesterase